MSSEASESFIILINNIANKVFYLQFFTAIIGIPVNIFHLFICLFMKTNSTNTIIISIAISDLIVLSMVWQERIRQYFYSDICVNQESLKIRILQFLGNSLQETFTRVSFWLGISLALLRFIILKFPFKSSKFSSYKIGTYLFFLLSMMSSLLSAMYYIHLQLYRSPQLWKPSKTCSGFPENYTETAYLYNETSQNKLGQQLQYWYRVIIGVLQILVSIIYPIVAMLLLFELIKAARNAHKFLSSRSTNEKHRTGRMILVMTVFYVISSAPEGIMNFIMLFMTIDDMSIIGILLAYGTIFMSFLYCLTATLHCFICFFMSTEYRKTVKKLLGIEKNEGPASGTQSAHTH